MNFRRRAWSSRVLAEYSKSMWLSSWGLKGSGPLGEAPGQFRHRPRRLAGGHRLLAGGGAGLHALGDALQDGGDAEHVVGHVEVPVGLQVGDGGQAGAVAVAAHVLVLGRDAERRVV